VIFLGMTVFLFVQYRKQTTKTIISKGEIMRLKDEIGNQVQKTTEISAWKTMFDDLKKKFEYIRRINTKLKKSIALLVPEAQR
jgi:hypothetical protein